MAVLYSIPGNHQRLDGGAMFGNAPRAVWQRWCAPDALGRIGLACRAMLVDEGDRKVLFEAGVGAFFEPGMRERYGVEPPEHVLLEQLAARGVAHPDIDLVVLSHLHFDHAGGLLAAHRPGCDPELLFPNARFVVGAEAWERARRPHLRDRASFVPALVRLLEQSDRLHLVEGPRDDLLGDAYHFQFSDGHTPGMMLSTVRGRHQTVTFVADLVPGVPWVHLPITMGYDRFAERLIDEKSALLEAAVNDGRRLFFTHDLAVAHAAVVRDDRGRFVAAEVQGDDAPGLDLDR